MSQVFISYRRTDSQAWADKLYRQLSMRFGKDIVFKDVDSLRPGDWRQSIREQLSSSQIVLVVIGPHWLDAAARRRLNDRNDVLRMEIAKSLSSKKTVIPLLVGNSPMPSSDDLPKSLKSLPRWQAFRLSDKKWFPEVEALIEKLRVIIWPTSDQISLEDATAELRVQQGRYFSLLVGRRAADALELAQNTQAYLDKVLPLYPQDPELKVTRGYLFKNEAMAMIDLHRQKEADLALDKAEAIFRTMIEEHSRDASAWNGLGSVEMVRGNFDKAHRYVDKALLLLPDYSAARADHAQILARVKKSTCRLTRKRPQPGKVAKIAQGRAKGHSGRKAAARIGK